MSQAQPITITVGIPAHNEANNIKRLLTAVVNQTGDNFKIDRILVVSDGSSDDTVNQANSVSSLVTVLDEKDRKGKSARFDQIIAMNNSDIFVQFDADCLPVNDRVLSVIAEAYQTDPELDLFCGDHGPLPPKTFGERVAYFGDDVWKDMINRLNKDCYRCVGHIRGFSRKMASVFRLPSDAVTNEDLYSFFYAKAHGMKTKFDPRAKMVFKLPDSITDYLRQLRRTNKRTRNVGWYFDKKLVAQYAKVGYVQKFVSLLRVAARTAPHVTLAYLAIQSISKLPFADFRKDVLWKISESSKKLN